MGMVSNITDKYQPCIDECTRCAQACFECFKMCLNEPNIAERRACIGGLVECAMLCRQAASAMSMDARFAKDLCRVCMAACEACAAECGKFDDTHCPKCAYICRQCAAECEKMSAMPQSCP